MSHLNLSNPNSGQKWRWWVVLLLGVSTLVFGIWGMWLHESHLPGEHVPWKMGMTAAYHTLQMFILHTSHFHDTNVPLEIGRWSGAATFFFVSFMALARVLSGEVRRWRFRWFGSGHTVVYGLERDSLVVVKAFREDRERGQVVVIDVDWEPELARVFREAGALVIVEASLEDLLVAAKLDSADELAIVCEDDREALDVAMAVKQLEEAGKLSSRLICDVQVNDPQLRLILETTLRQEAENEEKTEKTDESGSKSLVKFHYFDRFDHAAKELLEIVAEEADADHPVQLAVLGMGRMGMTVAHEAARQMQEEGLPLQCVHIFEQKPDANQGPLFFRYERFGELHAADPTFMRFHVGEILAIIASGDLEEILDHSDVRTCIAICFDNDRLALDLALNLQQRLKDRNVCILPRVSYSSGVRSLLRVALRESPIRSFGALDEPELVDAWLREARAR